MKKLVAVLGMTLAATVAMAQTPTGSGADARGARMQGELGLTDEQAEKMREIREAGGSKEDMRAVLTPEQQAKAAKMRKAQRGDMEKGEQRPGRMKEQLGLSDEQLAEMKKIREQGGSGEEIRAVMTPEQQAKTAKMREMRQGETPQAQE